jgi:hypothetical protein
MSLISSRFLTSDKGRAAPARLSFSKITPITGNSAVSDQTIRLHLPSNRVGVYADPEASFLQFSVVTPLTATMSPIGALGFLKNIVVRNTSNYLSTIDRNEIYRNILSKCVPENVHYNQADGSIIHGMKDKNSGIQLVAATKYTFCIFMTDLGMSFFQNGSYIPLFSADSLEIDLLLGKFSDNFSGLSVDYDASSKIIFSDIVLNLATLEVPAPVDASIIKQHGGVFKFMAQNVGHYQNRIDAGASSSTFTVGMSYSSLNRLVCVLVNDIPDTNDQISLFSKNRLMRATLLNDGIPVLTAQGLQCEHDAVNLCYSRVSNHCLTDTSVIQSGRAEDGDYKTSAFMFAFDLESLSGKSESLRSSLNVSMTNTQLVLDFGAGGCEFNCTLHVFPHYDALISLDLSASRNFEISI